MFGRKQSGPRDWETIKAMLRRAAGNQEIHMSVFSDGDVWITVEDDESETTGKGSDPWKAMDDLASKSDAIASRAHKALGRP